MNAKLYVLKKEFTSLLDVQNIIEEIMKLSDQQQRKILENFEEAEIMKRAEGFLVNVEKKDHFLICKHDFLDKISKIRVHTYYIELFDIEDNIFVSFLQRLYRYAFLIEEISC